MKDEIFREYSEIIESRFGIKMPLDKNILLETRLKKLFLDHRYEGAYQDEETYLYYLKQSYDQALFQELAEVITTNHTYFMREREHYRFLVEVALPEFTKTIEDGDLRTWCAAASSGEEAYSLAIFLDDFFTSHHLYWDYTLLATDIATNLLETAIEGEYREENINNLPSNFITRYFTKSGNKYTVVDELKEKVLFRRFNLKHHFPFKKPLHLIFCCNVLMYFDDLTKRDILKKITDNLAVGGYFFVGHSEIIPTDKLPLEQVEPSIYRRTADS